MTDPDRLSRRRLLGLVGAGAAGVVAGGWVTWRINQTEPVAVAAGGDPPRSPTTSTTPVAPAVPDTTTTSTTTTEPPPLESSRYVAVADEVFAEAKLTGARVVEALMAFAAHEALADPVERAMAFAVPDLSAVDLARSARPLFVPGTDSTAQVVYPQLGGLHPHSDPTTGSIMVVVAQHLRGERGDAEVSRCVDVRVRRVGGEWLLEGVEDASGEPVSRPAQLGDEAQRVLEHPDIDMPDSVRWDIYDGIVDRRILHEMAELADQTPIGITTCMRGHPVDVFGTAGRSAHSVGRAVDIWAIDHQPVVQQRDDTSSVAYEVTESLFESRRVHRLGSPWAFDGTGGRSWTDPVHLDHLHLGVSA
jgi:hypothetical protein